MNVTDTQTAERDTAREQPTHKMNDKKAHNNYRGVYIITTQ